jgi:hypothetical protein
MGRIRTWSWRVFGWPKPPPEPALVPRRPRLPIGSGSVAIEPPPEPEDIDARGGELPDDRRA